MAKSKPYASVDIDADLREGHYVASFMSEFLREMSTEAHVRTVNIATHERFSSEFDKHMSRLAETKKQNFFHVYEFSPTGDPYQWVGKTSKKLWKHTRSGQTSPLTFSFNWKAAQNYNPTYKQRRTSNVGKDGMRAISDEQFQTLIDEASGRRHKFVWKAPMLENAIPLGVYSHSPETKLFVPFNDGRVLFTHHVMSHRMAPGETEGYFVREWTKFWRKTVPEQWDKVIGEEIEKDAQRRIEQAIAAGKTKPRKRKRTFGFEAAVDTRKFNASGKRQAERQIMLHQQAIKQRNAAKEFDDFG